MTREGSPLPADQPPRSRDGEGRQRTGTAPGVRAEPGAARPQPSSPSGGEPAQARTPGRQQPPSLSGSEPAQGRAPGRQQPSSLSGGEPAQGRALGRQGQRTVRKLLDAALVEFDERGFQAVRVDDVVRRANTSHGTFYLYFANKNDLFKTLLKDALDDMQVITDEFPVVTRNESGRAALRQWVHRFCDVYAAHATVIRILSQADPVEEEVYGDGLQMLFRLAEAITQGMTAGAGVAQDGAGPRGEHAELTAVACLMMLERVNYLLSVEVRLPREEMEDRVSAIMYAAFHLA